MNGTNLRTPGRVAGYPDSWIIFSAKRRLTEELADRIMSALRVSREGSVPGRAFGSALDATDHKRLRSPISPRPLVALPSWIASDLLWEVPLLTCGMSRGSAANRAVREF
jgi:hypothetical protein